jgi:plastocyanin domain-containing protein
MKSTAVAIVIAGLMIGGTILFTNRGTESQQVVKADNVSVVDGVQIVEINARGGYQPRVSVAKAGIPTVIRFNTKGTFDCSSVVRIPSMNISKFLPQTGSTDIAIGTGQIGTLQGSCGMGMYPFSIDFQ